MKKITDKSQMEAKILLGMSKIASITKRTLGPGGLPIIIERQGQALNGEPLSPLITKDGVTVAGECSDSDPEVDLIIQSVKEICRKTNRVAGDGTTTAIVLGEAILNVALGVLKADSNLNPQLVRESVEEAALKAIALLKAQAIPVQDPQKIEEVATISANGDRSIGKTIREAFDAVGSEGVITVDEGHANQTTIQVVDGFQVKRGAEAQDRFFNNRENSKFEAENVHVVVNNGPLQSYTQLLPAFECIGAEMKKTNQRQFPPILFIADEFSQEVLQFLLMQKAQAMISTCAVRSPHMSNIRTAMMDDIAVMLGGERLGSGNKNIQSITYDDIGIAGKVSVDKYTCTFYDGQGTDESVLARVEQLKAQKASAESPYDASIFADRIAALAQGVAIIGVGGMTEMEIKERYHRIEDALNAARAAVEEGVISGGGIALARVSEALWASPTQTIGEIILATALEAPFMQILENIGKKQDEASKILELALAEEGATYDAREKKVVAAFESGIIDPLKVCRTALENAVSIAGLLMTCGGGIVVHRKQ